MPFFTLLPRPLPRRRLLALGLAAPFIRPARAAAPEVVLCNWGGDAVPAFTAAFVEPYEKATGARMVLDGSGPTNGKIRAMVEARAVSWDLCDSGVTGMAELAPRKLLAPIDYGVVDKSKVLPGFAYEYGVCNYMYSTVQAWDTRKVQGTPTLADFFDLKKVPGRRLIRKECQANLEMALLADGVKLADIYPLDVGRALAKLGTIKEALLTWDTGAQSQALLRDGEVSMGWLWHTRANLLKRETQGRIDWSFDGGVLQPGLWAVPRGNPAGAQAMVAIAAMQEPAGQIRLLGAMGNGPANPEAAALVPEGLQAVNPSSRQNAGRQVGIDADWYAANYGETFRKMLDFLSA